MATAQWRQVLHRKRLWTRRFFCSCTSEGSYEQKMKMICQDLQCVLFLQACDECMLETHFADLWPASRALLLS